MRIERYKLILKHDMMLDDGTWKELDKPLAVEMCGPDVVPGSIVVNEMLNRLAHYMLEKVREECEQ